jgi:hypothetical protein
MVKKENNFHFDLKDFPVQHKRKMLQVKKVKGLFG